MDKITFINGQAPFLNEQNLNQLQTNVENAIEEAKEGIKQEFPTKVSELENDKNFIENNQPFIRMSGRVHAYNNFDSNTNRIDISAENIQGAEPGGSRGTLYINRISDKDVRILENGTGTLYYKGKEVADKEYVDEKISDIEVDIEDIDLTDYATKEYVDEQISNIETGGGITELPIASATTLGGIKVGANLTIDAEGVLSATGGSGENTGETIGEVLPIGTMVPYASANNVPPNWRICDGSEVSRTTYSKLFNVIGTSYGEGDGETTFNLPNKRGRVSVGLDLDQEEFNEIGKKGGKKKVVLTIDEMPIHSHEFTRSRLYFAEEAGPNALGATSNASNSAQTRTLNEGGNKAHDNIQPYEVDVWIIKVSNVVGVLENENANVIDNLTSTSTTDVLSANMGREISERLQTLENANKSSNIYSSEDVVVGKWYNGKPIYRRLCVATKDPANNLNIDLGDTSDFDNYWINNGASHLSANGGKFSKPINVYESASVYIRTEVNVSNGSGNIFVTGSNSVYYSGTIYVVFEHTKIND